MLSANKTGWYLRNMNLGESQILVQFLALPLHDFENSLYLLWPSVSSPGDHSPYDVKLF